jgi:GNAT superfamily N-acetyltransferase
VRAAEPAEARRLTELALRSKAWWGYGPEFMERCAPVLAVSAAYVRENPVFVAESAGEVLGFYSLRESGGELELDLMFVEPARIRTGVGRVLLAHALDEAGRTAHRYLMVESDPGAEPFYLRFGAERVALRESTVEPGRLLPWLRFDLGAPRILPMEPTHWGAVREIYREGIETGDAS